MHASERFLILQVSVKSTTNTNRAREVCAISEGNISGGNRNSYYCVYRPNMLKLKKEKLNCFNSHDTRIAKNRRKEKRTSLCCGYTAFKKAICKYFIN